MARIAGVDLPRDKKILYALPYIYGIGLRNAKKILAETGVNADARVRDLRDAEVARLRQVIERDYKVEGALRTEVAMNIKRLMDIGTYRGTRHRKGLPVRGQRTHTTARTKKGPRRAIAGKKKPLPKKEMAQAEAAGTKRDKTTVEAVGIDHITATFNITLITTPNMQGHAVTCGSSRRPRFQDLVK